ncbi:MAG: hypothetical protein RIT45_3585 [Pseudomonadota bacterium]|jgi:ribosome-associated toxin RatA of RatAB toxin-antitoxin module
MILGLSSLSRARAATFAVVALFGVAFGRPGEAGGDEKARLEAGEVIIRAYAVKGSELPRTKLRAVINAPMEKVWAVIERCNDYKRTMVRVIESKELSRKGNVVTCRVKVDMPWPIDDLAATTRAVHTAVPGKSYSRVWSLVDGDYKANEGGWKLTPWGDKPGRTYVEYEVYAVPKIAVPVWIQKKAARSALTDLIERLRKFSGAKP